MLKALEEIGREIAGFIGFGVAMVFVGLGMFALAILIWLASMVIG